MTNKRTNNIRIVGARENNLKNVSLEIPKHKITVLTGVSGSGKSSLVFDTIAAESQRQLNETYSSFVRHRLAHYGQPDADLLENLSVAMVVNQKRIGSNARSTVGTVGNRKDTRQMTKLTAIETAPKSCKMKLFYMAGEDGYCQKFRRVIRA